MTIAHQPTEAETSDEAFGKEFKPLTAEEARQWRFDNPTVSPWWVVVCQLVVGIALVLVSLGWGGKVVGVSVAYGVLAVVLPAALMVRGLQRQAAVAQSGAAMLGFMVWELVKVVLTVAMLLAAPKLVSPLNWLALVAGFVVTIQVYWVAAWLRPRRRVLNGAN